ncbi:isopentenyl-diphosphate Delta-isomerase [Nemorincola caseinilytica]|uniref:Isopentenyl-diphosphate delta-isomerase n=1 Tax=Nemorincola caseinilytica TaxID=2054315 RepID=A0ABP8NQ75_9BACT
MTTEQVVLVDDQDREIGVAGKMEVHVTGALHRAVSVFIFSSHNKLLLQQRAAVKYHSGLLWTNTCCGHPLPGESPIEAAERRLYEEMGIRCLLIPAYTFLYKADMGNGLTEHEFDHVFVGLYDAAPDPDPAEVAAWRYVPQSDLMASLQQEPEQYTAWFRICMADRGSELFGTMQHGIRP